MQTTKNIILIYCNNQNTKKFSRPNNDDDNFCSTETRKVILFSPLSLDIFLPPGNDHKLKWIKISIQKFNYKLFSIKCWTVTIKNNLSSDIS